MIEFEVYSVAIAVHVLWTLYTVSTCLSFKLFPFLSPVLQNASSQVDRGNTMALPPQNSCFLHQSETLITREKNPRSIS